MLGLRIGRDLLPTKYILISRKITVKMSLLWLPNGKFSPPFEELSFHKTSMVFTYLVLDFIV